jgi:hypothetical protein
MISILGGCLHFHPSIELPAAEAAAEDIAIAHEATRGWECQHVGYLKIGFDIPSLGPADARTGRCDPMTDIRRIEVKGRCRGQTIRLTTNEWYKAVQLGDMYWLYVIWDLLESAGAEPPRVPNLATHLDYAMHEAVAARYFDVPTEAVEVAARKAAP